MPREVADAYIEPDKTDIEDLIDIYSRIHGFTAASIYEAIDMLLEMLDKADLRFLSFTGNLVSTGLRGILAQLLDLKIFNVVITTCGAIDHDIAKGMGGRYLKGSFDMDDLELAKKEIHRLGNILIPKESYGLIIERFTHQLVDELTKAKKEWGPREILREAGKKLSGDRNSILGASYRNNIPIYVPGITDGAFGTALYTRSKITGLKIDLFKDMDELAELVFKSRVSGALILGGGISKHHTIWWNQFKEGLDYAIYITTAIEWDGSLSGARPREAISWGKLKERSRNTYIYGDATVIMPIIAMYIIKKIAR